MYFSNFEQGIIRNICSFSSNNPKTLGELIVSIVFPKGRCGSVAFKNPEIFHLLCTEDYTNKLQENIIELDSLLTFLEDNRYVVTSQSKEFEWVTLFYNGAVTVFSQDQLIYLKKRDLPIGKRNTESYPISPNLYLIIEQTIKDGFAISIAARITKDDQPYLNQFDMDNKIMLRISKALASYYYPTPKLRLLIDNGYKTEEELYNEKVLLKADCQISKANWALILSFISICISIAGYFIDSLKDTIVISIAIFRLFGF